MTTKTNCKNRENLYEVLLYIFCLLIFAEFVYSRGQDRNWDLLNYHFFQGYSLLNDRFSMDLAPAGLQSFFNPLVNAFAYLSLKYLPFPLSAWSILAIQLTSLPAIILLAKKISFSLSYPKTFTPAIPAIILSLLSPIWGSELGTTFFSSWTAPLILWGVYLLYSAYQEYSLSKFRVFLAGTLFGLAAGLKLTNMPFAVSGFLMCIVLHNEKTWRVVVSDCASFLMACVAGFAVTAWWNWHLWKTWESPLFPFYNAIFKSKYFDFFNFRDMRWYFSSPQEFFFFIVDSFLGTKKTSEVYFADARYLFVASLISVAIFCKPAFVLGRQLMAFIVFTISGYLIWAFMFAYQRYLIPIELLLGLLIWILVARIVENERLRKIIMICLTLCAALRLNVPDWWHAQAAFGERDPFSIEMNPKLSATPGRYIVVGNPISYVLPSLHPASSFYGVGLSRQVDDLIYKKLAEPSQLPLRILANNRDASLIPERLKQAGYNPLDDSLECNHFKTGFDRYIICELQPLTKQLVGDEGRVVDADFTKNGYLTPKGILWENGLSAVEPWGRWSEGDRIEFGLIGCLPQGRHKLIIIGRAFGPNANLPAKVALGNTEISIIFKDNDTQQSAYFTNEGQCVNKMTITIPKPTSPQELGRGADLRKLGLGLVSVKIIRDRK